MHTDQSHSTPRAAQGLPQMKTYHYRATRLRFVSYSWLWSSTYTQYVFIKGSIQVLEVPRESHTNDTPH
jgi:hypothetical protein